MDTAISHRGFLAAGGRESKPPKLLWSTWTRASDIIGSSLHYSVKAGQEMIRICEGRLNETIRFISSCIKSTVTCCLPLAT